MRWKAEEGAGEGAVVVAEWWWGRMWSEGWKEKGFGA